jgi:hypothetical protein
MQHISIEPDEVVYDGDTPIVSRAHEARTKLTKEEKAARSAAHQLRRNAAADRRALKEVQDRPRHAMREAARARLRRISGNADAVHRVEARKARLATAAKHEAERVEHLVHGRPRAKIQTVSQSKKRRRIRHAVSRVDPLALSPEIEREIVRREEWSHKHHGTYQTWEYATKTHQGAIAQLHQNGSIDDDQLAWAAEIGKAAEAIEHDVDIRTASMESRVDTSPGRFDFVGQRIAVVRLHVAYTYWRDLLPHPKRLVLDMLIGDPIGFTVAARRHRVHNRRAKRELIAALERWPACKARARANVSEEDVDGLNALIVQD